MEITLSSAHVVDIARVTETGELVTVNKSGKVGSFARAIMFGDKQTRLEHGQALIVKWLRTGNYRPVAQDVVEMFVPKSAQPFMAGYITPSGQVSKQGLIDLCTAVVAAVAQSAKEPKGNKAVMFEIVRRIAGEGKPGQVIEA